MVFFFLPKQHAEGLAMKPPQVGPCLCASPRPKRFGGWHLFTHRKRPKHITLQHNQEGGAIKTWTRDSSNITKQSIHKTKRTTRQTHYTHNQTYTTCQTKTQTLYTAFALSYSSSMLGWRQKLYRRFSRSNDTSSPSSSLGSFRPDVEGSPCSCLDCPWRIFCSPNTVMSNSE
jgi:hypothetical protein